MLQIKDIEAELIAHKVQAPVIRSIILALKKQQDEADLISKNLKNILPGLR